MKKTAIICLFSFISFCGISQNGNSDQNSQKFNYGIKTGLNYTKLPGDTTDLEFGAKPLVGLVGNYEVFNNFNLNSSLLYSPKGSTSTTPNFKIRNQYIDMILLFQYGFSKTLFFQAGLAYSYLVSSRKIVNNGNTGTGIGKKAIDGYSSVVNYPVGIEFKLQDNVNFELNYFIPSSKNGSKNFQFSINIALNHRHRKDSFRKLRQMASKAQILQLKSGTLLVSLKTSENKINALKETGKLEIADRIENQQRIENIKIISAFKKYYNFSSMLFFYSNASAEIMNKKFKGIFLDDSLRIDNSIIMDTNKPFFIAEFSTLSQDTAKYFSYYSYDQADNGGITKTENYYKSSSDMTFYDLYIRDKNFIQLNKPFPASTRVIHKWSFDETVALLNKRLVKYYLSAHKY